MGQLIAFRTFLSNLSDEFLACRADGHGPWRALTAKWDEKARVYDRRRQCGNCGTVKPQTLDRHGFIIGGGRGYEYPDGYLATNVDLPSLGEQKAAYRLELMHRQMSQPRRRTRKMAS